MHFKKEKHDGDKDWGKPRVHPSLHSDLGWKNRDECISFYKTLPVAG